MEDAEVADLYSCAHSALIFKGGFNIKLYL